MWEILVKGGVVMIPIGICSILALGIIFERLWSLRRSQVVPRAAMRRIESLVREGDLTAAREYCAQTATSLGNILMSGMEHAGHRRAVIKEIVEEAGRQEVVHLERYLNLLGAIASLTPLLGLLGTVLGMIKVFAAISAMGLGNPGVLAGGISEALITTAAGLTVAIPALAMHQFFEGRVEKYVSELEFFALMVVDQIKSGH